MFDLDKWKEIFSALLKNPWRTALTALGISWGIFMLTLMFGAANGLKNGLDKQLGSYATNSLFLWGGVTSKSYKGLAKKRRITFENADIDYLKTNIKNIDVLAPRNQLGGWKDNNNVVYKNKSGAFSVYGDYPNFIKIEAKNMIQGRFLNDQDIEEKRKICVVGLRVKEVLFPDQENIIGEYISCNGVYFKIVGVFGEQSGGFHGASGIDRVFIPFTTFQKAFNYNNLVSWFAIKSKDNVRVSDVEDDVVKFLKRKYNISPDDKSAIGHFNLEEQFDKMSALFIGMNLITWIIGGMSLFAGVIGISNIMLVVVKERTREIGVRRAIGATPINIIFQIIFETVVLTLLAGVTGLISGMIVLEIAGNNIEADLFFNPIIETHKAIISLVVLIMSGILSGLIPALKAVRIKPVEALRTE